MPSTFDQVSLLPTMIWPSGELGMGAPQILPLTTAVRQESGFSAARLGYSRTASPERYGVRSWNLASSMGPTLGMPWFGGIHIRSGRSPPARIVANLAGYPSPMSSTICMLNSPPSSALRRCQNGLSGMAGAMTWNVSESTETGPVSGLAVVDGETLGMVRKPASRPSALPGRSGVTPVNSL